MPVSQGFSGGLPGLTLKAWAVVRPDGTIVRQFNVSAVAATADGAGFRKFTFAKAMDGTDYMARYTPMAVTAGLTTVFGGIVTGKAKTVNDCIAGMATAAGNVADVGGMWEFYE